MNPKAIIGAVIGGIVGALLWALITFAIKIEVGYFAIGVGFLVGFGAGMLGGHSKLTGIVCAIVALFSIVLGRTVAVKLGLKGEIISEMKKDPRAAGATDGDLDRAADEANSKVGYGDIFKEVITDTDPMSWIIMVIGVAAAYQTGTGSRSGLNRRQPVYQPPVGGTVPPPSPYAPTGQPPIAPPVPTDTPVTPPPPANPPLS